MTFILLYLLILLDISFLIIIVDNTVSIILTISLSAFFGLWSLIYCVLSLEFTYL